MHSSGNGMDLTDPMEQPIMGFDREDARDVIHLLAQVQETTRWMQDRLDPLEQLELYATLQHLFDAAEETEQALRHTLSAIKPTGE